MGRRWSICAVVYPLDLETEVSETMSFRYFAAAVVFCAALPIESYAQENETKKIVRDYLDQQSDRLSTANQKIWSYAETSLEETKSSQELQSLLKSAGFSVETGIADMPTAFVASYGSGAPTIGILAEFDALPGLSQGATPNVSLGPNAEAGHACGHSIFGVGSVGAAMAIAHAMDKGLINGTVKLYGTPAEETAIGKIYMLRDGYFKDDDAIFAWHPSTQTRIRYNPTMALVNVKFRFRGMAAHAAAQPDAGRSALDAVELMNMGVNMMREHIRDDARIHYVITDGGGQPNVVPPNAEVWYYIRAQSFNDVSGYLDWIKDIAAGAARMTQTALASVRVESEMHDMIPVRSLAELMQQNLEDVGPPKWSEDDLSFARQTQKNFFASQGQAFDDTAPALYGGITPLNDELVPLSSSTDVADISWFVPVGNMTVASFGFGLPIHSWPVVAATGTDIGNKALLVASKTIASTAIDLYQDADLLADIKADFAQTRGESKWETLIPDGQKAPTSVR